MVFLLRVQSIPMFLKFLGQNFNELFINPLYQNQYDFVEVKTFEAEKDSPSNYCIFANRQQRILNASHK